MPDDKITATVTNRWVTLKGKVDWEYQRTAAANAIRDLGGVSGAACSITGRQAWAGGPTVQGRTP